MFRFSYEFLRETDDASPAGEEAAPSAASLQELHRGDLRPPLGQMKNIELFVRRIISLLLYYNADVKQNNFIVNDKIDNSF